MTILCYHSVEPGWRSPLAVAPTAFAEQCAWLVRSRRVVDLTEAVARLDRSGRLPHGTSALTFDDGFASIYDHAFPVLRRHGLPATVFLVAGTLGPEGLPVHWIDTPAPHPIETLAVDRILEMQDAGVRFGSHSLAHLDLTTLSEDECQRDLRTSRELLEDMLGRPVPFLAYPRGRHDERARRAAERAGYTHAFTLPEGRGPVGRFAIPRVGVYPGNGLLAMRAKTARWYLPLRTGPVYPMLRAAVRRKTPAPVL